MDMELTPDLSERLSAILGDELVIERELGGGGMSRVFVAYETALQRRVVVKVLPDEIATVLPRERFRREILTSATLQHPNIVSVISAGDEGGLIHFIMPFIDGESLRGRIQRDGTISPPTVVSIMRDVARALAFAHERGVIHRDIKPDNVLLSGGTAVVADFGVAKAFAAAKEGASHGVTATLTNVGMSLGTPAYMAPEQVAGDSKLDARTDLYALGAMAYEALSGRAVFPRESVASILRAHLTEDPEPLHKLKPGIPSALEEAVIKCLAKDPKDRPQSANELLQLLENPAVLSGAFTQERKAAMASIAPRSIWRLGASLAVVAGIVAAGIFVMTGGESGTTVVATRPALPTIAVLPLLAVAEDSSSNYLAFGVTDEIINALARIGGVRVTSRAAAQDAQRRSLSLTQLGDSLGVTHALEGTIQKQGNAVHVAVRLVNTADGLTAWSEVFDGSADEVFDMQRYIAGAVAEAVRQDLAPRIDSTLGRGTYQPKPAAHDAYLQAHYELARRGDGDLTKAVAQLREAVAIDSQYAAAWAELAQALTVLPLYGKGDPAVLQPEAQRAAQRAIAIDSTMAAAHAALGNLLNAQWRYQDGLVALRKAVALDSTYAPAQQWLGENLLLNGDIGGAEQALARAVRLDSTMSVTKAVHGVTLALLKRNDESDRLLAAALARTPSVSALHVIRATALIYTDRLSEAVSALEVARILDPQSPLVLGTLGYAYGRTGNRQMAEQMQGMTARDTSRVGAIGALGKIRLGLGDTTAALDYFERALRSRDPFYASEPLRSPIYAPLHGSARFARIVQAAGLDSRRVTAPRCC
jgi:TolB-like protein/tRNA A-37 threonylcarbamoyl transferase component Bud32/Flp pilus assembly protein TadD